MKRLQKVSDETKLQKIAEILDEDHDGIVNLSEVLQVNIYLTKFLVFSYSIKI